MQTFFEAILSASFHGSIVILAVILLRLLLRKSAKKYICFLWLLAGIRLLMPIQIQSEFSMQPDVPSIRWEQQVSTDSDVETFNTETTETSKLQWYILLWSSTASLFALSNGISYHHLRKKVQNARRIPGGWESDGIDTAFILGFIRPQIYIPQSMPEETRNHILAHERTHLDKGDHWIKMIGFLALALHWFNPLVWLAYFLLCKDLEMACDERVVQFMELPERKEYSTALLTCSSNQIHLGASPVAFGETSVKSRILRILNYKKPSFYLGLLNILAIIFVVVCLLTSPAGNSVRKIRPFVPMQEMKMTENPDLGFPISAMATSSTSAEIIWGNGSNMLPQEVTKEGSYWLERWTGKKWDDVPMYASKPQFPELYSGSVDFGFQESFDWSLLYGSLPEGNYRVGTYVTCNGQRTPYYAWFYIYANALPETESKALTRCKDALHRLAASPSYSVKVFQSSGDDALLPSYEILSYYGNYRTDYYLGSLCYNQVFSKDLRNDFTALFPFGENKHISFPREEGLISDSDIHFLSQWTDLNGNICKEINQYHFSEDGSLSSIHKTSFSPTPEGTLQKTQLRLETGLAEQGDVTHKETSTPNLSSNIDDSPWGISFNIEPFSVSKTGAKISLSCENTLGVSNFSTDDQFWLEEKMDSVWEKLTPLKPPVFQGETYRLSTRVREISVDWTNIYGNLKPGLYRMGKRFSNGSESTIQFSQFVVYREGSNEALNEDAKQALSRVRIALDAVQKGNYHISSFNLADSKNVQLEYWKYGNNLATQYNESENALPIRTPSHDLFAILRPWDDPHQQILFAPDDYRISDEEIRFASYSLGNDNWPATLYHYAFFFDEAGNLSSIHWGYTPAMSSVFEIRRPLDAELRKVFMDILD